MAVNFRSGPHKNYPEALESRFLCSTVVDSNGFTEVTPDATSHVIYVSAVDG